MIDLKIGSLASAFLVGFFALACSSSSDAGGACGASCAGATAGAGAPPGGVAGAFIAAGSANDSGGAGAGTAPPESGGASGGPQAPWSPECRALSNCCAMSDGTIGVGCYDVILQNVPQDCLDELVKYAASGCPNPDETVDISGFGGASGSGGTGGSGAGGAVSRTPVFGKGFSTAACTSNGSCLAVIAAFGAGSDCSGVATVSCPFEGVSGCCIYANAESCYYGLTDSQVIDREQSCAGLGSWSPTP